MRLGEPAMPERVQFNPTVDELRGAQMPASPSQWHSVVIRKVHNGFIVEVGCKTFVSKEWAEVCHELGGYWDNPEEAEKRHTRKRA